MRKMFTAALAGVASLALTAPAMAQDADAPFDGVYVGGAFGFDHQGNDVGEIVEFDRNLDRTFGDTITSGANPNAFSPGSCNGLYRGSTPTPGCTDDDADISYYGRVGLDKQFGNIVVGLVGEFGKSEIRDSVTAFSTTPAAYALTRRLDYEGSIRVRAGYAANTTLFYGTVGGGYANLDYDFTTTNTANTFSFRGKDDRFGIVGGGGIEQKITPNISVGLEYLYHGYDDNDFRVRAAGGPAGGPFTSGNAAGTDFRRNYDNFQWHSFRATAAFRF